MINLLENVPPYFTEKPLRSWLAKPYQQRIITAGAVEVTNLFLDRLLLLLTQQMAGESLDFKDLRAATFILMGSSAFVDGMLKTADILITQSLTRTMVMGVGPCAPPLMIPVQMRPTRSSIISAGFDHDPAPSSPHHPVPAESVFAQLRVLCLRYLAVSQRRKSSSLNLAMFNQENRPTLGKPLLTPLTIRYASSLLRSVGKHLWNRMGHSISLVSLPEMLERHPDLLSYFSTVPREDVLDAGMVMAHLTLDPDLNYVWQEILNCPMTHRAFHILRENSELNTLTRASTLMSSASSYSPYHPDLPRRKSRSDAGRDVLVGHRSSVRAQRPHSVINLFTKIGRVMSFGKSRPTTFSLPQRESVILQKPDPHISPVRSRSSSSAHTELTQLSRTPSSLSGSNDTKTFPVPRTALEQFHALMDATRMNHFNSSKTLV
ncbi:hypothetical protein IWQ61_006340 [Dispira simplex]|nr:hypothetical protein IWQ61_006340 [Dispira simplex]